MSQRFSQRHGYGQNAVEITLHNDAPAELRSVLVDIAYECGFTPTTLRKIVCKVLRIAVDSNNWSEYPYIDQEVRNHLEDCDWHYVYDVVEEINRQYRNHLRWNLKTGKLLRWKDNSQFSHELNAYFRMRGIGWQLVDGLVEIRGSDEFESSVREASTMLEQQGLTTAHSELRESLRDLSRRPDPDMTGAIQHAMSALECVARGFTGDEKATLGKILSTNPNLLPKPLDEAVEKAWGYASERGRHLREGCLPSYEDAELTLAISSAVCRYLVRKQQTP